MRFLNYFLTEFLGALAAPENKEEEKELKHFDEVNEINKKDSNNIIDEKIQKVKDEDISKEVKEVNEEEKKKELNKTKSVNSEIKESEKEEVKEKDREKEKENNNSNIINSPSGEIKKDKKEISNILSSKNSELKSEKKKAVKDEREMTFLRLNLTINSPQLILKPRPSFSDYFIAELGIINIQAFYQKITGKLLKKPEEWRWLTTYQMRFSNCNISRNDGFKILSKTNGIVNIHFTSNTPSDLLLPPSEVDTSFQLDVYFNEFLLNLRQKDYVLLLKCNDLNIMYTDEKEILYDYAKYKNQKTNTKLDLSKTESFATLNSNEISSNNINSNNNIDLSKYMNMLFTLFINRITLNIYLDDQRELAQLILDEFFLLFKQKMDFSSIMGLHIRNIEVFTITENNDREVIVSDFSQLINQYDEDDNDSVERKKKDTKSMSGCSSDGRRSSSDFDDILETLNINNEQKRDSFIYNEIKNMIQTNKSKALGKKINIFRTRTQFKRNLVDLSNFGYFIVKHIQKCEIINITNEENEDIDENKKNDYQKEKKTINENVKGEEIQDYFNKTQFYARLKINTKHDKIINIKLDGLKFLIRIDKIYLIQAFFVDGMPFYDPDDKNLPNLFEDNEENFPAMKFDVEIQNPLICLLSDSLMNSNQEMYCIKSEIKFFIHKEKISNLKKKMKREKKTYEYAIKTIQNTTKDEKIIKSLEKKMKERTSWKMKVTINDVSPFICKLKQVLWSRHISIAKRQLTNNFNLSYSNKTKICYDTINDTFKEKNKNLIKISKINANLSFQNIMLFTKVMIYFNSLQGPQYQKDYESLLNYTHKKKEYDLKIQNRENEKMIELNKGKLDKEIDNNKNIINEENLKENIIIEEKQDEININEEKQLNDFVIIESEKEKKKNKEKDNKDKKKQNNKTEENPNIDGDSSDDEENNESDNEEKEENKEEEEDEIKEEDDKKRKDMSTKKKEKKIDNGNNKKDTNDNKSKKSNEKKKKKGKKSKTSYYQPLDRYTINGFDIVLIDNQENSFFPFIHLNIPKLEYETRIKNDSSKNKTKMFFQFHIMLYNYISGIWEPLIENTNCHLLIKNNLKNKDQIINKYRLQINKIENNKNNDEIDKNKKSSDINNKNEKSLNINISNLTISCLYPIFIRWSESYKRLNEQKNRNKEEEKKNEEKEKKEKKMKISNHILYNYTGKQIILENNIEDNLDYEDLQNDDDYIDFNHLNQYQEIIDDRKSYEIEYKDLVDKEEENDSNDDEDNVNNYTGYQHNNNYNNTIKINLKEYNLKEKEIKIDKISIKKIHFKSKIKLSKDLSKYSYIVSKIDLNDKKKSIFLFSPLCFKNKTEYTINIKLESEHLPTKTDIKLGPQEILPIPHEYMGGYILIKIGDKTTRKIKLIDFMNTKDLLKEIEFQGIYVNLFYSSEEEEPLYRIIQIKTYYVLRNLLPFEIFYSMKMSKNGEYSQYRKLLKNEKTNCNYVSLKHDLIMKLKFLDFETISPSPLYTVSKKEEEKFIILKFQDKEKQETDIICTIMKKGKITLILHPNSILLNHVSKDLTFYYGKRKNKEKENKEIPGKISYGHTDKKGYIFLLKSDVDKIHIKHNDYISAPFSLDVIGTETIIKCYSSKVNDNNNLNKNDKKKYIEFVMKNKIFLLAKDLDLYCNIIEFAPKYIINNNLQYKLILSQKNSDNIIIFYPRQREPFYFFEEGENCEMLMNINDSNVNWDYSYPFSIDNQKLITLQLLNSKKKERKFINITSKLFNLSTILTFSEAKIKNARIRIYNYSSNVSMKVYQDGYQNNEIFVNPSDKSIFAYPSQISKKIIGFNFWIGELKKNPIMINHHTLYELLTEDLNIIIDNENNKMIKEKYPYKEEIDIEKHSGQKIELSISTDGDKFLITIIDKKKAKIKIKQKIVNNIFKVNIHKIGLSIIDDNAYTTCKGKNFTDYNRIELCYITFQNLQVYYETITNEEIYKNEIQVKFEFFEIDNQISPFTNFPIVIFPNYEYCKNRRIPDFFNAIYRSENNLKENFFKITELKFLIQSFYLNIESNLLSAILNLVKNITTSLKTSFTNLHPLYLSDEENSKNHIIIKSNYSFQPWLTQLKDSDSEDNNNVLICLLETSPIDIIFSFISENKDKLFHELLLNNPVLRKFSTLISNIEKTHLTLNKDICRNISGNSNIIFASIIDTYKQYAILQLMKIGVNIEILGTPVNLIKSLGTGVKDFFQKPVEGMISGPLEGVKGIYSGTKSLVKNTLDGTLNTVSKITSGVSKEILIISRDEDYINERERKNMMDKPNNVIEGIGYGISSMMSGIFNGVTDVVRKPLEGAKKGKLKGLGKGILRGLGGLVAKPVSGVVDLISKTTDGIKNTWNYHDKQIFQQRYPRPFYGKFKYIKNYNWNDAAVINFVNKFIPIFRKKIFNDYIGNVSYKIEKGEQHLLVFGTNEFYLIQLDRNELIISLGYENIKKVDVDDNFYVRIEFMKKINGKTKTSIKIDKNQKEKLSQKIIQLFGEAINVDN